MKILKLSLAVLLMPLCMAVPGVVAIVCPEVAELALCCVALVGLMALVPAIMAITFVLDE